MFIQYFRAFFTTFTPFLLKICILSRCVFYNISVFAASFKTFVFLLRSIKSFIFPTSVIICKNVVNNTTQNVLTLAFLTLIIEVAFEYKCYTKAKNKNRLSKI